MWNPKSGKVDRYFSQNVPDRNSFVGLAFYPTNNRVYTINKSSGQVLSFATSARGFAQPVVSIANLPNASGASDLTIDSNIYIYLNGEIVKYTSGKPAEFTTPPLLTTLGAKGKLYTEGTWNGLYVLDTEHNRILILNKKGELISTLESDQFKNMRDFVVDEKGKTIYVLSDSTLLKVNF
jgi:6-phosphogluconolactonase (cycloisomerase 2 family)